MSDSIVQIIRAITFGPCLYLVISHTSHHVLSFCLLLMGLIRATVLSSTAYQHVFWRRYAVPAVPVVTVAVRCALMRLKMSQNSKLLRARCVSQAQNVPKPVFDRGSARTLLGEFATLPQTPWSPGRGCTSPFPSLRQ